MYLFLKDFIQTIFENPVSWRIRDSDIETVINLLISNVIDIAQLHGSENDEYIKRVQEETGKRIIKAFPASKADEALNSYADLILFDNTNHESGKAYDYSALLRLPRPFIVAGGISSENAASVINLLNPFALDASSSVETNGFKGYAKIQAFIKAVRETQ